jgi:hypothetical protein
MPSSRRKEFKVDLTAEERAGRWRADGNEASERGDKVKAEKCYAKAQYWLDRANKARGWGE